MYVREKEREGIIVMSIQSVRSLVYCFLYFMDYGEGVVVLYKRLLLVYDY